MPTRRTRLSKTEQAEHQATLSKLEKIHVETGRTESLEPTVKRFTLEQISPEFARVYDLPNGSIAVSLPAKLTILKAGVMFTDAQLFPQWDNDWPLDLEQPQENRHFEEFIRDFPTFPPEILNEFLVDRPHPLRVCQLQGLIIASGWSRVPIRYPDEKLVSFELCLRDEEELEYIYRFKARVDRRLKCQYERQRPDPQLIAERLKNRVPLFSDREKANAGVHRDPPSPMLVKEKIPASPKYRWRIQ